MTDPPVPSLLQLDLFRAVEDVHDLTNAIVVLIVDADGRSVAVSGDEDEIPKPVRAALGGRALAAAGSARELLSPLADDLAGWPLNLSLFLVGQSAHVLVIVFDAEADLAAVQTIGAEARDMIEGLFKTAN